MDIENKDIKNEEQSTNDNMVSPPEPEPETEKESPIKKESTIEKESSVKKELPKEKESPIEKEEEQQESDQVIDFSSQPLGVVSQEGEQIEDDLNKEYELNEELRKQRNAQSSLTTPKPQPVIDPSKATEDNPAPIDIDALPKSGTNNQQVQNEPAPVMPALEVVPAQPSPTPAPAAASEVAVQPVVTQSAQQVSQPAIADKNVVEQNNKPENVGQVEQVNTQVNQVSVPSNNNPAPATNQTTQENGGNFGVVLFLILLLVGGGAIFIFLSDKGESLVGSKKEDYTLKESKKTEEEKKEPEAPEEKKLEEIKNFNMKNTLYISGEASISITSSGVVDMVNKKSKMVQSGSLAGRYSKNITMYCDYNISLCYSEDPLDANVWHKEPVNALYLGPDEAWTFLNSLGTLEPVNDNGYIVNIKMSDAIKLSGSTEEYSDAEMNAIVKTEVFMENSRIKRIKYDFTEAYKSQFSKVYGVVEYSDINKYGTVEIPENVINSAK